MPTPFESEISARLADIQKLSASKEARDLVKISYASSEAETSKTAHAFIARAKELGLAGPLWFIESDRGYDRRSGFFALLRQRHCQGAIKALALAGASVWPIALKETKRVAVAASFEVSIEASFMPVDDVARMCFASNDYPIGSCKACLSSAVAGLESTPESIRSDFFPQLASAYKSATAASSATSLGVLGKSDKRAKTCAEIVSGQATALRSACAALSPTDSAVVEELIADAAARLSAKNRASEAAFDPEKLKKSFGAEQKLRLRTLWTLLDSCPDDSAAAVAVMADTPWLATAPQALCVRMRSSASVAQAALRARSGPVLEEIDRLGGNLWLASAQSGEANACLWAPMQMAQGIGYREREEGLARARACMPILARMLAYGAYLDGAPDPVAHAVAKTYEADKGNTGYWEEIMKALMGDLRSRIESLALEDLLKGRDEAEGEAPAPARKRSRL